MNSVEQRMRSENKKAEHSRVALHPGPDQEPANTNANRSIRQDCAEKRHNLTGHSSPVVLAKDIFYLVGFGCICRKMRTVFN